MSLPSVMSALSHSPYLAHEFAFAEAHVGRLESELERLFLLRWAHMVAGTEGTAYSGHQAYFGIHKSPRLFFNLRAQQEVCVEDITFRADFLLDVVAEDRSVAATAAIETDGYAFHCDRRTFRRDRVRDQAFLLVGIPTFRFTWDCLADVTCQPLVLLLHWTRKVRPT